MKFDYSKKLLTFANISHAFSTKESKNLAFHVDDEYERVLDAHKLLSYELGYELKNLQHMKQVHGDDVVVVSYGDFYDSITCDALITNKANTPLMVMVADCSAMLFYDKINNVIAVCHAGRVGAFKNITKKVIDSFVLNFGSNPKDIVVAIGANIKSCCYEVQDDVILEAMKLGFEYAIVQRGSKKYLDIDAILKKQLSECGIYEVEFIDGCSCCNTNRYYSYRKEGKTGRFAGVIYLK